ncbi:hypothetical protein BWD42_03725 [Sphingobacterium sp. CZ-UAM]|nr:hypothetical protein BWD42_03725 [Sphingobacterium sp. CZ-UAM]
MSFNIFSYLNQLLDSDSNSVTSVLLNVYDKMNEFLPSCPTIAIWNTDCTLINKIIKLNIDIKL